MSTSFYFFIFQGEYISPVEHSVTPTGHGPPLATPATSTPKYNQSNSTTRRLPLEFVSGNERNSKPHLPKVSQSVSSIVLGTHSRVVEGRTPRNRKSGVGVARNMQHSLQFTSMQGKGSGKVTTSDSMAKSKERISAKSTATEEKGTSIVKHSSVSVTGGNHGGTATGNVHISMVSRGSSDASKSNSSSEEMKQKVQPQHERDKASPVSRTLSCSMEVDVSPHFPPSRSVTPVNLTNRMTKARGTADLSSVPSDSTSAHNQSSNTKRQMKDLTQSHSEMGSQVTSAVSPVHPPQPPPAPPTSPTPPSSRRRVTRSSNPSNSNSTSSPASSLSTSLAPPAS